MAINVLDNGKLSFIPPSYMTGGNWSLIKQVYDDIGKRVFETGIVEEAYLEEMQAKIEAYK